MSVLGGVPGGSDPCLRRSAAEEDLRIPSPQPGHPGLLAGD